MSAFQFIAKVKISKINYTKVCPKVEVFGMPSTAEAIQFGWIFSCLKNCARIAKKLAFIDKKKITFKKIKLDNQHCAIVNPKPFVLLMLEIKSIPNYLHGHTISDAKSNQNFEIILFSSVWFKYFILFLC